MKHTQLVYRSGFWNAVKLFFMTRAQAAEVVEAHMRRRHLEGYGSTFICVETHALGCAGHISLKHSNDLRRYVNDRIRPFYTASDWAVYSGRLPAWRTSTSPGPGRNYTKNYDAQRLQQELELRCELLHDYIKDCS